MNANFHHTIVAIWLLCTSFLSLNFFLPAAFLNKPSTIVMNHELSSDICHGMYLNTLSYVLWFHKSPGKYWIAVKQILTHLMRALTWKECVLAANLLVQNSCDVLSWQKNVIFWSIRDFMLHSLATCQKLPDYSRWKQDLDITMSAAHM